MNRKQFYASVKSFITQNDMDLQNAVLLLGGAPALMRIQRLRRSLAKPHNKGGQIGRELNWLYDLLSLENVGDFGAEEAGYFAMINPDHPVVWSICLLTEAVADLIEGYDSLPASASEQDDEVAA